VPLRQLVLFLLAASTAPLPLGAQTRRAPGAEIVFLDVGQGDAILIRSDTFNVLIDAGRATSILEVLDSLGVDHINLLIATHNHIDHIGGMDAVIDSVPVGLFVDNGCEDDSEAQAYVLRSLDYAHLDPRPAWDTTFTFGAASLRILPSPFYRPACDSTQNNLSVGVILRVGHFSALLTGDSERYEESAWLKAEVVPDVDVLKAAHHGADNGVTPGWVQAANPEVVVISVGHGNAYHHPCPHALAFYRTHNRRIWRTDQDGSVSVCVSAAGEYRVWGNLRTAAVCAFGQ
jgi:competence protein ComEC